jgi:hypothetical protein
MAKFLYATNCSRGVLLQDVIFNYSEKVSKGEYLPMRRTAGRRNFSHYLSMMGHEVDLLVDTHKASDQYLRAFFHRNAKALRTKEVEDFFFKANTSNGKDCNHRFFSAPNLFSMPIIAKIIDLSKYDMVICDSAAEWLALDKEGWQSIFDELHLTESFYGEILNDSLGLARLFEWIDSPFQHKDTQDMGDKKTLYSLDMLRGGFREKLLDIDNLFYARGYPGTEKELFSPLGDFFRAEGATNCEKALDAIFSPIDENKEYRYHIDEIITKDIFEKLPQIEYVRKNNRIDRRTLFEGFNSAILLNDPQNSKDSIFHNCGRALCFENLSKENYGELFFGTQRFTNKGYEELSKVADGLV